MLINVAFITLLERKILGYRQLRKGPNKVRIGGLAQPFNDAIKLFSKEIVLPSTSNLSQYLVSPLCALVIVLQKSKNKRIKKEGVFLISVQHPLGST